LGDVASFLLISKQCAQSFSFRKPAPDKGFSTARLSGWITNRFIAPFGMRSPPQAAANLTLAYKSSGIFMFMFGIRTLQKFFR